MTTRPRHRLPPDDEFREGLVRHGYNRSSYARELGMSPSGINNKARRLGIGYKSAAGRSPFRAELDQAIADIERLTKRVEVLEARPPGRIIEWRPNHRRHVDGGEPVRKQRKAVGL